MIDTPAEKEFRDIADVNEALSYMKRGRALKDYGDDELSNVWAACVERWFRGPTDAKQRDMNDAAAEIRVRGRPVPTERLGSLLGEVEAALDRTRGKPTKDGAGEQSDEFVRGNKGRQKE
jgi:hypothetical protein